MRAAFPTLTGIWPSDNARRKRLDLKAMQWLFANLVSPMRPFDLHFPQVSAPDDDIAEDRDKTFQRHRFRHSSLRNHDNLLLQRRIHRYISIWFSAFLGNQLCSIDFIKYVPNFRYIIVTQLHKSLINHAMAYGLQRLYLKKKTCGGIY